MVKVFMSPLGERKVDIKDAQSTDFGGILNLLLNSDILSVKKELVKEAVDYRNLWAHSPCCEVKELNVYKAIDAFSNFLSHKVFLEDEIATENLGKLQKLRRDGLSDIQDADNEAIRTYVSFIKNWAEDIEAAKDIAKKAKDEAVQAKNDTARLKEEALKEICKEREQVIRLAKNFKCYLDSNGLKEHVQLLENTVKKLEGKVDEVQGDVEVLERVINLEIKSEPLTESLFCNVPETESRVIIERKEKLSKLEQVFFGTEKRTLCNVAAVRGLGGCGKTSLVADFANRHNDKFPGGLYWLNGRTEQKIKGCSKEILDTLGKNATDEPLAAVSSYLLHLDSPWIVIINDIDKLNDQSQIEKHILGPLVERYRKGKGNVLFTTRLSEDEAVQNLRVQKVNCLELGSFSQDEALNFFCKRQKIGGNPYNIIQELGCFPLALEQAAAYINKEDYTFEQYLDKYRIKRLQLMTHPATSTFSEDDKERASILTTWDINFDHMKEKYPKAADMLNISALLDPDGIPLDILVQEGSDDVDGNKEEASNRQEMLSTMTEYSLAKFHKDKQTYSIHKMVQEVLKDKISSQDKMKNTIIRCANVMTQLIESCETMQKLLENNILSLLTNTKEFLATIEKHVIDVLFLRQILDILCKLIQICIQKGMPLSSDIVLKYIDILELFKVSSELAPGDRLSLCEAQVRVYESAILYSNYTSSDLYDNALQNAIDLSKEANQLRSRLEVARESYARSLEESS